jgi:hypothetical protein
LIFEQQCLTQVDFRQPDDVHAGVLDLNLIGGGTVAAACGQQHDPR